MTNHRVRLGHLFGILLVSAIFFVHPCCIYSQDLGSRYPAIPPSENDCSSAPGRFEGSIRLADNAVAATLPDDPMPQDQSPPSTAASQTQLNQFSVLSPRLTRAPLSTQDKFHIYEHKAFGPPAVILPALGAGLGMLNPPNKYPKEWKDGAGAFGKNYGYRVADHTSRITAQFLTGALLHEDARYLRSTSSNPFKRTVHALEFTIFDKTDSGRTTLAASNFASAAAGGFVGMGMLPDGYNDVTHAEQRMAGEFLQIGIGNVITEFEPQWGPLAKKLRVPNLLPGWWVPERRDRP